MNIEIMFLVEEAQEGGYIARAIDESIFTEADTMEALKEAVKDAVRCHFDEKKIAIKYFNNAIRSCKY